MEVQIKQCDECLFSDNKIVSEARKKDVIRTCLKENTYFTCHKATAKNMNVCCKGYWDMYRNKFNLGRIAQRIGGPNFVKVDDDHP